MEGLVRVRNLIMPTCSPNLPAFEIGLGSISEEMETLFILIRPLEQGHLQLDQDALSPVQADLECF